MVVRFRKKVRKMRGYDRGFGEKKKHRGKGSRGGKGYAGSTKHKRFYIQKYEPLHLGYKGFHSIGRKENRVINIRDLEKIASGKNEINLTELGYDKLLGRGEISAPLTVRIAQASKSAKDKIEKAGGKIAE